MHHAICRKCAAAWLAKSARHAREIAEQHNSVRHYNVPRAKVGRHVSAGHGWAIDRRELLPVVDE